MPAPPQQGAGETPDAPATPVGDATPVEIGAFLPADAEAFMAAYGISADPGDPTATAEALAADINSRGGLAGHPITVVPAYIGATNGDSFAVQEEAACVAFTEDHQAAAVVPSTNAVAGLDACLAQNGVTYLDSVGFYKGQGWFDEAPGLRFLPGGVSTSAIAGPIARVAADSAAADPLARMGVVAYDAPVYTAILEQDVVPALQALGHEPVTATVHTPTALSDISQTAAQMQSVVVQMRAAGVTHMLYVGDSIFALFATSAEGQSWHPVNVLSTLDVPGVQQEANTPAAQLETVVGAGTSQYFDLAAGQQAEGSARYQHCKELLEPLGWDFSGTIARNHAIVTCDGWFALEGAANAGGAATQGGIADGFARLGGFDTITVGPAGFGPGHPFAAATFRRFAFDPQCPCMTYTSEPEEL